MQVGFFLFRVLPKHRGDKLTLFRFLTSRPQKNKTGNRKTYGFPLLIFTFRKLLFL